MSSRDTPSGGTAAGDVPPRRPGRAPANPVVLGPLRVGWIRVERGGHGLVYRVVGTAHRRPVSRPVTPATAERLMASGVPVLVARQPAGPSRPDHPRAA